MLELQVKDYRRPSQAHGSWMEWETVVHNNAKRRQDYLCNLKRRFTWLVLIIVSRKLSQMSSNVFAGMSRQMVPFSSILLSSKSECNDRVATYGFDQRLPPSSTSSSNLTHLGLKWHFYKIQLSRHFLSICFRSDPERMMSYPSVTVHPSSHSQSWFLTRSSWKMLWTSSKPSLNLSRLRPSIVVLHTNEWGRVDIYEKISWRRKYSKIILWNLPDIEQFKTWGQCYQKLMDLIFKNRH